jgi:hypothetical protein
MESILDSEVLPEDNDYDMSVIVDATKMPQPEDVTEQDLKAVEVGSNDESLGTDNYTINQEIDYDILEQDYEEELSATRALNVEIERAAAELADNLGEDRTPMSPREHTAEFTLAEASAVVPLHSVSGINTKAKLPLKDNERTADMKVANDDESTEMEVSGGTFDTKRLG